MELIFLCFFRPIQPWEKTAATSTFLAASGSKFAAARTSCVPLALFAPLPLALKTLLSQYYDLSYLIKLFAFNFLIFFDHQALSQIEFRPDRLSPIRLEIRSCKDVLFHILAIDATLAAKDYSASPGSKIVFSKLKAALQFLEGFFYGKDNSDNMFYFDFCISGSEEGYRLFQKRMTLYILKSLFEVAKIHIIIIEISIVAPCTTYFGRNYISPH
jgi:hypothetical protein